MSKLGKVLRDGGILVTTLDHGEKRLGSPILNPKEVV
jgi:hypothetical protein